jgi:hypothetical protein
MIYVFDDHAKYGVPGDGSGCGMERIAIPLP